MVQGAEVESFYNNPNAFDIEIQQITTHTQSSFNNLQKRIKRMNQYQHHRNFSLVATQANQGNKTKSTNRSLRKIQNNNNHSWLLIAAKQYYHKTNNLKAAIANFEEYLTYYPNHQESLYLCAVCYMNIGQYTKAILKLRDYLTITTRKYNNVGNPTSNNNRKLILTTSMQLPNASHAYLLLSMAYNKINNISKAVQAVNQSIKIDNQFQQGYCFRAKLYLRLNQNQRAFYDYKQVLKYNNKCWAAWVGLGDYYTQAMNYQQALRCYEKVKIYLDQDKEYQKNAFNRNFINRNNYHSKLLQDQKQFDQQSQKQQKFRIHQSNKVYTRPQDRKSLYQIQKHDLLLKRPSQGVTSPTYKQKQLNFKKQKEQREGNDDKQRWIKSSSYINKPKLKLALRANQQTPNMFVKSPTNRLNQSQRVKTNTQFFNQSPKRPKQNYYSNINQEQQMRKSNGYQAGNNNINSDDNKNHNNMIEEQSSFIQNYKQTNLEVDLKIAICLYYLGEFGNSIVKLQGLLSDNKANDYLSEIYYYLAINQLKIYDEIKVNPRNHPSSQMPKNTHKQLQMLLKQEKIGVKSPKRLSQGRAQAPKNLLTTIQFQSNDFLQKSIVKQNKYKPSQLLHQSILNLQSSIKSNNNKKIMAKSCKTLIKLYVENNQFYETQGVIRMFQKYQAATDSDGVSNSIKEYKMLSEACMLIIKQKYQNATPLLKKLYEQIIIKINNRNIASKLNKGTENRLQKAGSPIGSNNPNRIIIDDNNQFPKQSNKKDYDDSDIYVSQRNKSKQKLKQKQKCSSVRLSETKGNKKQIKLKQLDQKAKLNQFESQQYSNRDKSKDKDKNKQKYPNVKQKQSKKQKNLYDNLEMRNDEVKRNYKKLHIDIQSNYNFMESGSHKLVDRQLNQNQEQRKIQQEKSQSNNNQSSQNQFNQVMQTDPKSPKDLPPKTIMSKNLMSPSPDQLQWMIPIILLFRGYAEYFSDNFIQCLEVYEQYQNFIKDYLGKEPETDINLSYNKVLCEGILMLDNQMIEESLEKFMICVDNYFKLIGMVAVQPIIFRVLGMMRIAISESPILTQQLDTRHKIFVSIIQVLDHYMPALKNNPLTFYYYGLALYQLERYKEASDQLQKCLKIAEECTWKFLFVKGVIQIKNKAYKQAVRQFSAGLLVEERPEIYLGRCICYIQLFDQSQGQAQPYMEKSFEDLQKFIQLQQDKDKISKWVTKILFFNKAYQQVTKSIKKVSNFVLQNQQQMMKIQKCLNVFNGIFQQGGVLGQILINAFEGKFQQTSIQIDGERHDVILSDFIESKYKKWLFVLNYYSGERYQQLIKYLQLAIFQQKNQQELNQLRYNLALTYYLLGEWNKADNVLTALSKHLRQIGPRVQKFVNRQFSQDECVDDLSRQFKGTKRLSSFLPYRKVVFNNKGQTGVYKQKSIYIKISLPFPSFFKPDIDLNLDDLFLYGETSQTCIPKKIEAPWIKKVTGNIQFTDNVIQSQNSSLFQHDILSPASQLKSQSFSLVSSIKDK